MIDNRFVEGTEEWCVEEIRLDGEFNVWFRDTLEIYGPAIDRMMQIRRKRQPPKGLWWDEFGLGSESGKHHCSMCGAYEVCVVDHCHITGFIRGLLCRSCNLAEARGGPHWAVWEVMAPQLKNRLDYGYTWGRESRDPARSFLTDEEIASDMSVLDLLELNDTRREDFEARAVAEHKRLMV